MKLKISRKNWNYEEVAAAWDAWERAKEADDREAAAAAFRALQKATRPMMEGKPCE